MENNHEPKLYYGNIQVDGRGIVANYAEPDLFAIKIRRFSWLTNHRDGYVRAWSGNSKEERYLSIISGHALIGAVLIDNWDHPDTEIKVRRFVLSAIQPSLLYIPAGFAMGIKSFVTNTIILVLSTLSLEDAKYHAHNYPWDYWNIWGEKTTIHRE